MNERDQTVSGGYERPEDIERRIETTRQRMTRDIDAISNKLRPANLAAEAGEAITDRARRTGSGIVGLARDHPLPALAVGASLAWLFYSARRGDTDSESHPMHESTYTGVERRIGGYQNMSGFRRRFDDFEGRNRIERVKDAAGRITDDIGEKAHEISQRAGEAADGVKERASAVAGQAKAGAHRLTTEGRRRMHQLGRQTHEHPLKVAAGAAIAGLALGLLLPATRKENEVMGGARDDLMDRAEETASRVRDVAAEGVRHVAETVKAEAQAHAPELKSMAQDLKQQVAGQVKETATRAREEAKDAIRSSGASDGPSASA